MSARADGMARTRQQIIEAAAARIRASAGPLTLLDVAARAGVSRATLYRHFASVTALLDAVAADLLARARFDRLLAALEDPDPVQALREVVMAGTGIWAADTPLVRNLVAMASAQPRTRPPGRHRAPRRPPEPGRTLAQRPDPGPRGRSPAGHHRVPRLGRTTHRAPPVPGRRDRHHRRPGPPSRSHRPLKRTAGQAVHIPGARTERGAGRWAYCRRNAPCRIGPIWGVVRRPENSAPD